MKETSLQPGTQLSQLAISFINHIVLDQAEMVGIGRLQQLIVSAAQDTCFAGATVDRSGARLIVIDTNNSSRAVLDLDECKQDTTMFLLRCYQGLTTLIGKERTIKTFKDAFAALEKTSASDSAFRDLVDSLPTGITKSQRLAETKIPTVEEVGAAKSQAQQTQIEQIQAQNRTLEDTKRAMLNLMEDLDQAKKKVEEEVEERTRELHDEQARLKSSISSLPLGFMIIDQSGNVAEVNAAIKTIFSGNGHKSPEDLPADDQTFLAIVEKALHNQFELKKNMELAKREQKVIYAPTISFENLFLKIYLVPIISDENNQNRTVIGVALVVEDITLEKQIDQAKSEFVSLVSHQLRTPLSSINWYTEMLMEGDAGKLSEKQTEYLNEIYKGSKIMTEMVSTFLNISRIELGSLVIEPKEADLTAIIKSTLQELKEEIQHGKVTIKESYSSEIKPMMIDVRLTEAIVQNLLSNAVKYTPKEGTVSIKVEKDSKGIVFSVADTGYGIPKAEQKSIFKKMYRTSNVRAQGIDGTGLGLYLAKSIAEQSGCEIWFESEEGKGSTFYLRIPLAGMRARKPEKATDQIRLLAS